MNSVIDSSGLLVFKMAPLTSSTRELFSEAVRAVLETWPVLQVSTFITLYSEKCIFRIVE